MDFELDYYAILGIDKDADEREIKQAYRLLARLHHPDVSSEEESTERFREIQKAYEILLDPMQRKAYDRWRKQSGLEHDLPFVLRVTPSQRTLLSMGEPQVLYILAELMASDELADHRLPLNLCLVVDRSTSMKGARLHQVKGAAHYIVDQMGADDVLSIVTFSDRAHLVLPGRRGIDKTEARTAISRIRSGGGTEIFQGLNLGLQQVERWHSPQMINHLIMLTDGQTYGDEENCLEAARYAGEREIPITTMGIGSDWNDELLDEMSSLSHAPNSAIYIDSTSKIEQVFHDQIHGLGSTFAHNMRLALHQSKEVSLREIYRVSPSINRLFMMDEHLTLGSLESQHPQAIIMEMLVGSHEPGTHQLLRIDVEGLVPAVGSQPTRARKALEVSFVTDLPKVPPVPPDIVSAMGKLTIFKMQEKAMNEIELGQIESAVNRLKTMATRLLDIGEAELARAALLEAGRLAQTGSLSAEGRKKIRYGTRGLRIVPKEVRYD
jgi:Ca-activated chloride channel family protein